MSFSLENLFNKLSKAVFKYRFFVILLFIAFIFLSVIGASLIVMETGTDTYIDKESKLFRDSEMYNDLFSSESVVVMVEGQSVTDPNALKAMSRTEDLIREIQGVNSVVSPATVVRGINEKVSGRAEIPSSQEEVDALLVYAPPEFSKLVTDSTHCLIIAELSDLTADQKASVLKAIKDSVEFSEYPPGYSTIITGESALMVDLLGEISSSLIILVAIAIVLMFVGLYFLFKGVRWNLYPLLVVLMGVVFTFGSMGLLNIRMTIVSVAAFPILIGLGTDYAIQFQNRFEEEVRANKSGKEAFFIAFTALGPAVLTAVFVTSISFLSLLASSIPMVRNFGFLLIFGCFVCYISGLLFGNLSIYFFNALSVKIADRKAKTGKEYKIMSFLFPVYTEKMVSASSDNIIVNIISKWVGFVIKHKKTVIAIALVTGLFGFYLDSSIPAETDYKTYIPQDMPALLSFYHLDSVMNEEDQINLLIRTDDYASPVLLKWIDEFSNYEIENQIYVQSTDSLVNYVKEANGGKIPDTRDEVLKIYETLPKETVEKYSFGTNLLLVNLNIGDALSTFPMEGLDSFIKVLEDDIAWLNPPPGTSITVTGSTVPFIELMNSLLSGRVLQTVVGLILVFAILLLVYKDIYKALAAVIPISMVIGWSGIVMTVLGIIYTPMTSVLGCMILGIGAEYTILLMERYFEEKKKFTKNIDAMKSAATSTGIALTVSGVTTSFGFLALAASNFPIISSFGAVTVINMLMTILATFTIFPPLMLEFENIKERGGILSYIKNGLANSLRKKSVGGF
ncbi:MAG: RND family transporter [Methanosarcinaceae archaeon]|nr:RND family transporter [Methanosarcinaceae archaeon]